MKILIKQGVEVIVVSNGNKKRPMISKTMKVDKVYSNESIIIDPVGTLGNHKGTVGNLGGQFARDGFYGVKMPSNRFGYSYMLVHMSDVTVFN